MSKIKKEAIKRYLEIVWWVHNEIIVTYQDEQRKMLLKIIEKEMENPKLRRAQFCVGDTLEELEGFPPEFKERLFKDIRKKFGKIGKKFTQDRPVL